MLRFIAIGLATLAIVLSTACSSTTNVTGIAVPTRDTASAETPSTGDDRMSAETPSTGDDRMSVEDERTTSSAETPSTGDDRMSAETPSTGDDRM